MLSSPARPKRLLSRLAAALLATGSCVAVSTADAQVLSQFTIAPPDGSIGSWSLQPGTLGAATLNNPTTLAPGANTYAFTTQTFFPSVSGTYRFGQASAPLDTVMIFYQGSFDPTAPGANALAGNDDSTNHPAEANVTGCPTLPLRCPSLQLMLEEGVEYIIVISHFNPAGFASFTLPQTIYVFGPAGVSARAPEREQVIVIPNEQIRGTEHAQGGMAARMNMVSFIGAMAKARNGFASGPGRVSLAYSGSGMTAVASAAPESFLADTPGGGEVVRHDGVWTQVTGSFGKQRGDATTAGFRHKSGTVAIGGEAEVTDGLTVGLALGFTRADYTSEQQLGDGKVEAYQVGSYGRFVEGRLTIDGALAYGFQRFDVNRHIPAAGQRTNARYSGHGISAATEVRYRVAEMGATALEPFAGVQYDWMRREAFRENGNPMFALNVDSESESRWRTTLGAALVHSVTTGDGTTIDGELRAGWNRELGPRSTTTSSTLNNQRLTARTPQLSRNSATAGIALRVALDDQWQANAGYDTTLARQSYDHVFGAGVTYRF